MSLIRLASFSVVVVVVVILCFFWGEGLLLLLFYVVIAMLKVETMFYDLSVNFLTLSLGCLRKIIFKPSRSVRNGSDATKLSGLLNKERRPFFS